MRKLFVIVALLVVLTVSVSAKGTNPYGMAGQFKLWSADTIQQWGISLGLHFDLWAYYQDIQGSGYEWADTTDDYIADVYSRNPFDLTFCFFDWWEFSVTPTFAAHKVLDTEIEEVGLSELFIGTKFNPLFEEKNGYLPGMSLVMGFDLGKGIAQEDDLSTNFYDEALNWTTHGDTNIDFIYALSKHVGKNDLFSYHVNLGYRLTLGTYDLYEWTFNESTGGTDRVVAIPNYPVPDYFLYGAGFEVKATDNFSFITDLVGKYAFAEDQVKNGRTYAVTDNWFQVVPGIRLSGDDFLYYDFAVALGVGKDNPWIEVITGFSADIDLVPRDTDGDGIPDDVDLCPEDPEDFDGFEDADGCPDLDNDNDGIPDTEDKCPDEPEDMDGYKDSDGCPDPDNDSDGIPDTVDKCPNEPETVNGFEDEDGCPDTEPVVYTGPKTLRLEGVNFEPNVATMLPGSSRKLEDAAKIMIDNPFIKVQIVGHTTDRGDRDFLMQLSRDRAQAVVDVLVNEYGIDRNRLTAVGMGPDDPTASNSTESGREQNRRIEFKVVD
jgi:outer membrane protein OmpA-like peptidoglycan-associated protein